MKKIFLFLFVGLIAAGCTITERIVFNSKNGGSISYEIDATEFISIMAMTDSTGQGFNLGDSLSELVRATESIGKIKGIHHAEFQKSAEKVTIAFQFDDIEALNKAHRELGLKTENQATKNYEKVTVKNKKEWILRTWPIGSAADDSLYSTMGMMLNYKLEATFPKEVTGTSSKTVQTAGNRITWASSAEDPGGPYAFDGITVKMK